MGSGRNQPMTPDLFSTEQESANASSPLANEQKPPLHSDKPVATPSYALPTNLPSAIRHLDDDQLERLLSAVIAELKQRGSKLPMSDEISRKPLVREVVPSLPQGKLNAVRAAFKAGVTPSLIARQFGVSLSSVRKVLSGGEKK